MIDQETVNDNILIFPVERIVHSEHTAAGVDKIEQSIESIKEQTNILRMNQMSRIVDAIIPFIFGQLNIMGVRTDDERIVKSGAFLLEALKALLSYHLGLPHQFHKLIEKTMIPDNTGRLHITGFDEENGE